MKNKKGIIIAIIALAIIIIVISLIMILGGKEKSKNINTKSETKTTQNYASFAEFLTTIKEWEKEGDKGERYTFEADGTGKHDNDNYLSVWNITWTIIDNTITINTPDPDFPTVHSYTLVCDYANTSFQLIGENGKVTFVKKNSQVFKLEGKGEKLSSLNGVWLDSERGMGMSFQDAENSGTVICGGTNKVARLLVEFDWEATDIEIKTINLNTGAKNNYTYELNNGELKLYKDGSLYKTYTRDKDCSENALEK